MSKWWTAAAAVVLGMAACPVATAATPPGGTLAPDSTGGGGIAWTGLVAVTDRRLGRRPARVLRHLRRAPVRS